MHYQLIFFFLDCLFGLSGRLFSLGVHPIVCLYLTSQKTEAVGRGSSRAPIAAVFPVTKSVMGQMTVVTTLMSLTVKVNGRNFQGDFGILICKYLLCKLG